MSAIRVLSDTAAVDREQAAALALQRLTARRPVAPAPARTERTAR